MTSRIDGILLRARDTLADPSAERWSNDRLVRLVNEAQRDIAKQTKILKDTFVLNLRVGQQIYSLSDSVWTLTRATVENCHIDLVSHDKMDEEATKQVLNDSRYNSYDDRTQGRGSDFGDYFGRICWEETTGTRVEALVYDQRNLNSIKVYPIPNDSLIQDTYVFANIDGVPLYFEGDEVLGALSTLDTYTVSSVFGALVDLYDPLIEEEVFSSVFGVATAIYEAAGSVKVGYIRIPDDITSALDDLEIPRMFDEAIKHYVIAHAFFDDLDTRYQKRGVESLGFYHKELALIKSTEANSAVRRPSSHTTTYRNAFE